ncbi:hypothetical protein BSLG_008938 [Batrachochytrium salamandrivorans]|nr:hypothetical protein BSLG_008938 [Batrachochytrium salamandrivorans]
MGKLNLLPHKSQKNIDQVRRDEAEAEKAGESKHQRVALAEQESRLEVLRGKAKARQRSSITDPDALAQLLEAEAGPASGSSLYQPSGSSHRKTKAEMDKWEKKMTVYLGETRDGHKETPWYTEMDYGQSRREKSTKPEDLERRSKREDRGKQRMDPATEMEKYLQRKKHLDEKDVSDAHRLRSASKSRTSGLSSSFTVGSIEYMRQERLRRETEEKRRTQELLTPGKSALSDVPTKHDADDRFFNSQFNPSLIRRTERKKPDPNPRHRPY